MREKSRLAAARDSSPLDVTPLTDNLLIGAAPRSPAAVDQLVALGVTVVIDLRAERGTSDCLRQTERIPVEWVPTYDDWRPKSPGFFAALLAVWQRASGQQAARVLICCGAGEHRAPLGGALVLATQFGDLEGALRTIRATRAVAEFLPAYEQSLRHYLMSRGDR